MGWGDPYSRYYTEEEYEEEMRDTELLLWNRCEHYPEYGGWYSGGGLL